MKKIIALLLSLLLIPGLLVPAFAAAEEEEIPDQIEVWEEEDPIENEEPGWSEEPGLEQMTFVDVAADSPYYDAILWAVAQEITYGTGDGTTFSPDQTCINAQILTFLWRASGSPEPDIANPFTDVKEGAYYYEAALWACQEGIVSGPVFDPDAVCTRSMTVTYLWKLSGEPSAPAASFTDVSSASGYADAVNWAVAEQITYGTGGGAFSPDAGCTRGQIVTFLHRYFVL